MVVNTERWALRRVAHRVIFWTRARSKSRTRRRRTSSASHARAQQLARRRFSSLIVPASAAGLATLREAAYNSAYALPINEFPAARAQRPRRFASTSCFLTSRDPITGSRRHWHFVQVARELTVSEHATRPPADLRPARSRACGQGRAPARDSATGDDLAVGVEGDRHRA